MSIFEITPQNPNNLFPLNQAQIHARKYYGSKPQTQTRDQPLTNPKSIPKPVTYTLNLNPLTQPNPKLQTWIQTHNPKPILIKLKILKKNPYHLTKNSYASIVNPVVVFNPNTVPQPEKSFVDVVIGSPTRLIPIELVPLVRGEFAVIFLAEEIWFMAELFKLSIVGKFSFGWLPMDKTRMCRSAIFRLYKWSP